MQVAVGFNDQDITGRNTFQRLLSVFTTQRAPDSCWLSDVASICTRPLSDAVVAQPDNATPNDSIR